MPEARTAPRLSRAEKKQHTRDRILAATLALLADGRSLDGLGLREVARAADLAPTSLYNHFPDMNALGLALIEQTCDQLRHAMRDGRVALIAGSATDAIRHMIERFISYLDAHEAEFRLLVRQRLGASQAYRRRIHRALQLLVEELAEDVRQVVMRRVAVPVDVVREAEAAVAIMFGFGILAQDMTPDTRRLQLPRLEVQLQMVFLGGRALAAGMRLDGAA
ncbi:TetR family transcriptional regulator [Isoalcanivorax indicus]|uniref:TetR family transcriptional regulator n=1 Tax=Isoalcanivorax indicus TaxID=2202653 RepID=UPI000DBACEE5|nr:TetR family transcriptional regulator [Isoalcanivorax indicus]